MMEYPIRNLSNLPNYPRTNTENLLLIGLACATALFGKKDRQTNPFNSRVFSFDILSQIICSQIGSNIIRNSFYQILTRMTQDVEMKEQQIAPSNSISATSPSTLQLLKDIAGLIEVGAYTREVRRIVRAIRWTIQLRKKLKASSISAFLNFSLVPGSEAHSRLSSYVPQEGEQDMEVDSVTSGTQAPAKHSLPEIEIYCYLLVLIYLIDQKRYNEAKACSSAGIARLRNVNRRTVDVLAARLYFYFSLSYELTGNLAEIRGDLLALHRTATLRHDELGQETLLNLLLRNYLHYNLYDQAEKLRAKAPRFEAHSNQQARLKAYSLYFHFCRYLFYLGKIRTIQLEYTDAKESLLQAARKAPISALGFRVQCNKWAVIVRLLLGEIPERTVFMQKGMEKALRPYFELTNAVRIGDLELFKSVADKFAATFGSDGTKNLIVRLRHNVIRTGLRNISISYSRISLSDVALKLRLDSPNPIADAESIVSKAIRDGAIEASLDRANGWMVSKETGDIYSTNEPQAAFNSRIAFCLNMHNEAVRALRFPPNSHKEKESAEKRRERLQQEQELAKVIAEEDDDEF
ncbi:26S proteasome non-ATPase regulatory subunit 3 homolog A [Striga hermonthica]|uniref:Probable 26S proteasome non-ATPase regulatory subunit 3 n=1 Tax=Striga hermonthica TaxID=68872 RepID=A0A9N7RFT6_STRHE|nr:26S proteasome non-ATPase regulatory subunit 3 homolog A [Striga hermonthica]